MKDFQEWLDRLASAEKEAAMIRPETVVGPTWTAPAVNAPVALIASPHPDDEVIIGGLALRLRREGWRVVNLAVTLGSDRSRREARRAELVAACAVAGFELEVAGEGEAGLDGIRPETLARDPERWALAVDAIAKVLSARRPRVVFLPHQEDHHPTHIGTSRVVAAALEAAGLVDETWTAETEFWAPMRAPNLLAEVPEADLALLLGALRQHDGEVARNPYHLRLPAWMSDNVRRGSEWIGGAGSAGADFRYGTLYRLARRGSSLSPKILPAHCPASSLFTTGT